MTFMHTISSGYVFYFFQRLEIFHLWAKKEPFKILKFKILKGSLMIQLFVLYYDFSI